jgi:hypothetical protein
MRFFLAAIVVLSLVDRGIDAAQAPKPPGPPSDQDIMKTLPATPPKVVRDNLVIVKLQVKPGLWKCISRYDEYKELSGGNWQLLDQVEVQSLITIPAS